MAVERAGQVGDQQRAQAEAVDALGDELQIAGGQAGRTQHVDLARPLADPVVLCGDQRLDDRLDRGGEAALETAGEVRGVHRDHRHVPVLGKLAAELVQRAVQIAALGFRQRGGQQADHRRLLLLADHPQRLDDVVVGAHHRADLVHRRGLQRHRLAEVAHEEHLGERGAARRAVQQRHAARHAEDGQGAAHGLAGLQRADGQGFVAVDDLGHGDAPQPLATVAPAQGAGRRTESHTGLSRVRHSWRTSSSMPS
ncbi:hypothetical protein D3C85_323660 [compost metagenome]